LVADRSRVRRGLILLAIVTGSGLVAGGASSQPAPRALSGEELGHVRYEEAKKWPEPWRATDSSDARTRAILFQKKIAAPRSTDKVDIVATVTIDYRLTSTDRGDIRFDFLPAGQDREVSLRPGAFPLSGTNNRLETRTFVWSRRGVPADGKDYYSFQLEIGARDGRDRGSSAAASGNRVSVVVEMWPAD
jgi:hypothetical protein